MVVVGSWYNAVNPGHEKIKSTGSVYTLNFTPKFKLGFDLKVRIPYFKF
jgi:hypothetical protein